MVSAVVLLEERATELFTWHFAEEICKLDDSFFIRLDESFYQIEDKNKTKTRFAVTETES